MRLKPNQSRLVAGKIAVDLIKAPFVKLLKGKDAVVEADIIMNYDDRYSDLSHKILDELYEEYLIEYDVNDNQVKNVIFNAFRDYAKAYEEIDDIVYEKIRNQEKEILPGSSEYELLYEKYFREELNRRGML